MTQTHDLESLIGTWITLPDIAEHLDVIVTRVHKLINERHLIDVRRGERNVRYVPAEFMTETGIVKSLRGTIMVLDDAGFNDEEILRWLFTEQESLPGRPIDALHAGHKTEIRRRAQALAW